MRTYTRKQMGVIYRAVKDGKLDLTNEQVSYLYDYADRDADEVVCNSNNAKFFDTLHYGMRNAIDFIFAGDYDHAMVSINNMLNA